MKEEIQLIIPAAGPNLEFDSMGNHKLLWDIYNKKLIQWVQLSRPYDLSKGLFIFNKFHEKKYNLVKKTSHLSEINPIIMPNLCFLCIFSFRLQ